MAINVHELKLRIEAVEAEMQEIKSLLVVDAGTGYTLADLAGKYADHIPDPEALARLAQLDSDSDTPSS